jgi:hypothetical protein
LDLKDVFPSGLIALGVISKVGHVEPKLLCNERAQRGGRLFALLEDSSRKSQVTEHHGKAETIRIAATPIDEGKILSAQSVMAHHPALIGGGSIETDPLRLGEQFSVCHGCPF